MNLLPNHSFTMSMLAAEDENDAEVRREDQDNINQFATLTARVDAHRSKREALKVREAY